MELTVVANAKRQKVAQDLAVVPSGSASDSTVKRKPSQNALVKPVRTDSLILPWCLIAQSGRDDRSRESQIWMRPSCCSRAIRARSLPSSSPPTGSCSPRAPLISPYVIGISCPWLVKWNDWWPTLGLWKTSGDCSNTQVIQGHKGCILELKWSRDGRQLMTVSSDKTVWDFHHLSCETRDWKSTLSGSLKFIFTQRELMISRKGRRVWCRNGGTHQKAQRTFEHH